VHGARLPRGSNSGLRYPANEIEYEEGD
jgi:hypothetical protein